MIKFIAQRRFQQDQGKADGFYEFQHNDTNFFQQQMSALYKPCDKILEKLDQITKTCVMASMSSSVDPLLRSNFSASRSDLGSMEESKNSPTRLKHADIEGRGQKKVKKKSKKDKDRNDSDEDFLDHYIAQN